MDAVLILCYHGISRSWPAETSVTPQDFEDQLRHFVRRGYKGATLFDALTRRTGEPTLVVTFDDAHSSVLHLAAPAMSTLGLPGTVYVPTDFAASGDLMGWDGYDRWLGTDHEEELRCMNWDQLRALHSEGWEIGSHTCSHPRLSTLEAAEIESEVSRSRAKCEDEIGVPCRSIAYPYSDYDERAIRAVADSGYQLAVTVPRSPAAPRPFEWPRVGVYHGESSRRIRLRAEVHRPVWSATTMLAGVVRRGR